MRGELLNVLVGVDHRTSSRVALISENRLGNNAATISRVLKCLQQLGHHGRVQLTSDGEPALMDLLRHVAERRPAQTLLLRSPPYDSQSNGRVERTVRSIEEICRTLKLDVESRAAARISVHSPAFAWILRHGTMLLNYRQPGIDGRTSHHRLHGSPYNGELVRWGSVVHLKLDNTVAGGLMQTRWSCGVWLGKAHGSDEHLVSLLDGSGLRRARTVKCRDEPITEELLRGICELPGSARFQRPLSPPVRGDVPEGEHVGDAGGGAPDDCSTGKLPEKFLLTTASHLVAESALILNEMCGQTKHIPECAVKGSSACSATIRFLAHALQRATGDFILKRLSRLSLQPPRLSLLTPKTRKFMRSLRFRRPLPRRTCRWTWNSRTRPTPKLPRWRMG